MKVTNNWTEESILEDMKRFNSYDEWRGEQKSYQAAQKRKIVDKLLDLMPGWKRTGKFPQDYQLKLLATGKKACHTCRRVLDVECFTKANTSSGYRANCRYCRYVYEHKRTGDKRELVPEEQFYHRKSEAKQWQKTVQFLMENVYQLSLPLKAPAEIGVNFADAH